LHSFCVTKPSYWLRIIYTIKSDAFWIPAVVGWQCGVLKWWYRGVFRQRPLAAWRGGDWCRVCVFDKQSTCCVRQHTRVKLWNNTAVWKIQIYKNFK
jgi:hypothetical protein